MRLSDSIEGFIKSILLEQQEKEIELKRSELAERFGCVPSQINYVLATRFSPQQGYIIESRRGGGGYIRITRVVQSGAQRLMNLATECVSDELTEVEAARLIDHLVEQRFVTRREGELMYAAMSVQGMNVPIPENTRAVLRARMMKSMMMSIARQMREEEG